METKLTVSGCHRNGQFYAPGAMISVGYDTENDRCYGTVCKENGQITIWERLNCRKTTTTIPPTTEPTTTEDTTVPPRIGCHGDDGTFYAPGKDMGSDYDEKSNWCYGEYCDMDGNIVNWDNFNCKSTLPPSTTELPTTTTPTKPPTTIPTRLGCHQYGVFYNPGEKISNRYDFDLDKCYGTYCDHTGAIVQWDKWNCRNVQG